MYIGLQDLKVAIYNYNIFKSNEEYSFDGGLSARNEHNICLYEGERMVILARILPLHSPLIFYPPLLLLHQGPKGV
jgi:hypothetical protein